MFALLFLGLAILSCWLTANSFYLSLKDWPWWSTIVLAGAFYIVASLCFSLLLETFDENAQFPDIPGGVKGARWFSLLGLLFFWILFGIPTNTHSLVYNSAIESVANNELSRTKEYLSDVLNKDQALINVLEDSIASKRRGIDIYKKRLKYEVYNLDKGFGPKFESTLYEFQGYIGTPFAFQKYSTHVGIPRSEWDDVLDFYFKQADDWFINFEQEIRGKIEELKKNSDPKLIKKLEDDIVLLKKSKSRETMREINTDLEQAMAIIGNNPDLVKFNNNEDRLHYTRENAIPSTVELESVWDVWMGYFKSQYEGHGFAWKILLSVLIDIAAFVFFNMAFYKK